MRLHFLGKKIKIVLIFAIVILLLVAYSICMMWRSNRISDRLRLSDKAWVCNTGEITIYIYNNDNLPESFLSIYKNICKIISEEFYEGEYQSDEIVNSGSILLLVLKQKTEIRYFMLDFNCSGNTISHDGVLIEYDTVKNHLKINNAIYVNARMVFNNLIIINTNSNYQSNIFSNEMMFEKEK